MPSNLALRIVLPLLVLGLLTAPAWSQYNGPASCATPPSNILAPVGTGEDFYQNFAEPNNIATYAMQMPLANGANTSGDRNSNYFPVYFSLNNLATWMADTGYCLELVVGGVFPDVRYFAVAVNDEHYALSQHIADADMDPATTATTNPFTPNVPNTQNQPYLVPISLGAVPTYPAGTAGCGITPYEEDNLLDATQRHLSMDWNTDILQPDVPGNGLDPHTVDTPTHQSHTFGTLTAGANGAGSIIVRGYLPPYSCSGKEGQPPSKNGFSCGPNPAVATPYLFFRDVATGCPYSLTYVESTLLNGSNGSLTNPVTGTAPETSAVVSISDPTQVPVSGWLSATQQTDHTTAANITPQACYANGDPTQSNPPSSGSPTFYNRVAWARAPQYNGQPGPDDTYIGGAVSTTDLTNILNGSACGAASTPCIIRLRFKLPSMPNTCSAGTGCELNGTEQLRYFSLTFGQQQPANSAAIADIDGIDPATGNAVAVSFVSMADSAFTATNGYITLLLNVGATSSLPSWLTLTSGTGTVQGVSPGANPFYYYSAWTTTGSHAGYNVLDLNGFTSNLQYPFKTKYPLLLTIRENLPASTFYCSGNVVPFSTAEYIGAGGLMGPYVPLVDYLNPNDQSGDAYSLPASPPSLTQLPLPSGSNCTNGVSLPVSLPSFNAPTTSQPLDWPSQPWPNEIGGSLALNCGTSTAVSPQIDFVATQFPTPVDDSSYGDSPLNCNTPFADNSCSQVIAQALQFTEMAGGSTWQPPVAITLQGSHFGYLPGLPTAILGPSFPYLRIQNDGASQPGSGWDSGTNSNCQFYIANWTDSTISILANLPAPAENGAGFLVSPPSDVSPSTLAAGTACPVAFNSTTHLGDNLTITVTNPQSTSYTQTPPVPVKSNTTTVPY